MTVKFSWPTACTAPTFRRRRRGTATTGRRPISAAAPAPRYATPAAQVSSAASLVNLRSALGSILIFGNNPQLNGLFPRHVKPPLLRRGLNSEPSRAIVPIVSRGSLLPYKWFNVDNFFPRRLRSRWIDRWWWWFACTGCEFGDKSPICQSVQLSNCSDSYINSTCCLLCASYRWPTTTTISTTIQPTPTSTVYIGIYQLWYHPRCHSCSRYQNIFFLNETFLKFSLIFWHKISHFCNPQKFCIGDGAWSSSLASME